MARYEHLPIYRDAYDLTVHIEKLVRNFSRYHKYTLGTELRNKTRAVLGLRQQLESLKVLSRLCHDAGAFGGGMKSYLYMAERLTGLACQNEGWIKATGRASGPSGGNPSAGIAAVHRE